ncbi:hypothetical protein CCP3SC1AL1_310014 [Gammaproteobacteria bacterium]
MKYFILEFLDIFKLEIQNTSANCTAAIGGITLPIILSISWIGIVEVILYGFIGGVSAIIGRLIGIYIIKKIKDIYKDYLLRKKCKKSDNMDLYHRIKQVKRKEKKK